MNADQTEAATVTTRSRWTRFWKGSVAILLMPVKTRLIGLLLAGAMVFSAGAWLFDRQEQADARARQSQVVDSDEKVYAAAVIDHNDTVALYNACLTRVEDQARTRETLRTLFFAFSDLSDVLPDSPEAQLYTANRKALIERIYAPIDVPAVQATQCVQPGPAPVDPTPEESS